MLCRLRVETLSCLEITSQNCVHDLVQNDCSLDDVAVAPALGKFQFCHTTLFSYLISCELQLPNLDSSAAPAPALPRWSRVVAMRLPIL